VVFFGKTKKTTTNKTAWKKRSIWMRLMSRSNLWYPLHNTVKSWDSKTWFGLWQFKTWHRSGIFKCISWKNGSFFFLGDDRAFLKTGGSKNYAMAPFRISTFQLLLCL
jgi:hypothetical protein